MDEFLEMLNTENTLAVITDHRLVSLFKGDIRIQYLFYCEELDKYIWLEDTIENKGVQQQIEFYKSKRKYDVWKTNEILFYMKEKEQSNVLKRILQLEKCNDLMEEEYNDIKFNTQEQQPWLNNTLNQ